MSMLRRQPEVVMTYKACFVPEPLIPLLGDPQQTLRKTATMYFTTLAVLTAVAIALPNQPSCAGKHSQ